MKDIKLWFLITLVLIGTAIHAEMKPPLPEGWRLPTKAETTQGQEWRDEDAGRYLSFSADFNGDGVMDQALLLIRDHPPGLGLFASVSQKGGQKKIYLLDEINDSAYLAVMGISIVEPGRYKTACGKGYFECQKGEPEEIQLRYPSINYFKEGSANSFFYWEDDTNKFRRIWMSD